MDRSFVLGTDNCQTNKNLGISLYYEDRGQDKDRWEKDHRMVVMMLGARFVVVGLLPRRN